MPNIAGYGDEATWGPCLGRSDDPRSAPNSSEEIIRAAIETAEDMLGRAERAVERGDYDVAFDLLRFAGHELKGVRP